MKLTPSERVQKAKIRLLREHPFFGYCIMQIPVVASDEPKPAGPKIVYNPSFVEKLDDDELVAVLTHELLHYLLGHTKRAREFKKTMSEHLSDDEKKGFHFKMNIAEDIVINAILALNGFRLPKTKLVNGKTVTVRQGCIIPDVLSSNRTRVPLTDSRRTVVVEDPHAKMCEEVFWEIKDLDFRDDGDENEESMYFSDDTTDDESSGGDGKREWQSVKPADELLTEALNYSKVAGKTPAGLDRTIKDLQRPELDLFSFLRRFVVKAIPSDYTYLRPSKSSPPNVFLPSVEYGEHARGVVAIDTSASMEERSLSKAISEVVKIAREMSVELSLVYCDAEVQGVEDVRSVKDVLKAMGKARGGGGTDFRPVFEYAERKRASFVIYFTDGYGTFPRRARVPTLWVLTADGVPESTIPFGKVVRFREHRIVS
ncbi:vWA domain-containing protein [Archaeoglobus neptunius]|uniref:vWA domain-containing protein n=1 Tax=Archaeoglobus neptunius TaxID=2798580 RepID=UPI001926DE58|nr:VWA-like domain-containing protein [Archaeoglobus neptunius]